VRITKADIRNTGHVFWSRLVTSVEPPAGACHRPGGPLPDADVPQDGQRRDPDARGQGGRPPAPAWPRLRNDPSAVPLLACALVWGESGTPQPSLLFQVDNPPPGEVRSAVPLPPGGTGVPQAPTPQEVGFQWRFCLPSCTRRVDRRFTVAWLAQEVGSSFFTLVELHLIIFFC